MANVLAWLTGREDRTPDPAPVSVAGPELRSYSPSPSERFGNWISDALGGGQGASLARQNFATGVPSVMSLFPPLGIGLSALDYAHARATDNPGAAAAAAIGMVPGAGKLAPGTRTVAKGATDEAGQLIKQIEEGLFGPSAGSFIPPKPVAIPGTNPAMAKGGDPNAALAAIEEVLGKQTPPVARVDPLGKYNQALAEGKLTQQEYDEFAKVLGKQPAELTPMQKLQMLQKSLPMGKAPANYEVAPGVYAPVSNPVQTLQGNPLPPIASGNPLKAVTETPFEVAVQDPGSKMYSWHEKANLVKKGDQWFAKEGYDPAKNVPPAWVEPKVPAVTPKPIFDYEKDDTGLYHVFDAVSGKTHTVVDKESQAKAWINEQKAAGMGMKQQKAPELEPLDPEMSWTHPDDLVLKDGTWMQKKGLPATVEANALQMKENKAAIAKSEYPSAPWQAKNTGNSQVFGDLGIFPQEVPFKLPERAISQGYVTPAVHGTVMSNWKTPTQSKIGEIGDALRLPSEELGVHFGTPDQARHFTGRELDPYLLPRTYPTALQTGKSLELPDMGTWHVDEIKSALRQLNGGGEHHIRNSERYPIQNVKEYAGKFPTEELDPIETIGEMRDYLQKKGYDSVNYINAVEGPGQRSYIMFKPSPESKNFVQGVRSPFAAFDPSKMMRPELGLGIMGLLGLGAAVKPSPSEAASKGKVK